jgi:zona occludens toxin
MYEYSQAKPDVRKKVYACNFTNLDYDGLGVEPFEAHEWMKLDPGPNGAVLFFDEAWQFFESRSAHKMPPDSVKEMAKHRHYGFDMFLITQGPFQLDNHLRALVDTHLHVVRPFGMKFYNVRTFQGLERFPDDSQSRKRSADTTKRFKFDKKFFGFYKSAEVHTIKRKIPVKMIGAIVVLLLAIAAIVNLISWGSDFMDDTRTAGSNPIVQGLDAIGNAGIGDALPAKDNSPPSLEMLLAHYYSQNMPIVEGAPWTAPKYDEVMKPVTWPKPYCALIVDENRCICISQQGTKMRVAEPICLDLALNGFFDPTLDLQPGNAFTPRQQPQAVDFSNSTKPVLKPAATQAAGLHKRGSTKPPFTNWQNKPSSLKR